MRYLPSLLACCCLALAACDVNETDPGNDDNNPTTTLNLESNGQGGFDFCDADGDCQTLPNPGGCAKLVITIDNVNGDTCEECVNAAGEVISSSCEETSVACAVVTIPDPDCVVCAYVNGAIVFSSCVAEQPDECVVLERDPPCKVCYDARGNETLNTCGDDCRNVMCPIVDCAPGFVYQQRPGECCGSCYPIDDCSNRECASPTAVPECPEGFVLRQDPTNCCAFRCEPASCDAVMCPAIAQICPDGYELDFSYPHCCGTCVPVDNSQYCYSDQDCDGQQICTTSLGECLNPCYFNGDASNGGVPGSAPDACPDVCMGVCRPADYVCPLFALPNPESCDGQFTSTGRDEFGCPLPPVCVCADGRIAVDGKCQDLCADIMCAMMIMECPAGQHLQFGYPYCCGTCVPDDECWVQPNACQADVDCGVGGACIGGGCIYSDPTRIACNADSDCGSGGVCFDGLCVAPASGESSSANGSASDPSSGSSGGSSTGTVACAEVMCAPGTHRELGPSCCPICVDDPTPCFHDGDCASGEICSTSLGDCLMPPSSPGMGAPTVCGGVCMLKPIPGPLPGEAP